MSENHKRSSTPQLSEASTVDSLPSAVESLADQTPLAPHASLEFSRRASPRVIEEGRFGRSPDSEALASSDDEVDQQPISYFSHLKANSAISNLSSRRPSYAAEFQNRSRTYSVLGGTLSPATSNPATPAGEGVSWAGGLQTNGSSSSPFNLNWGSIWNSDSRKSPPKSLTLQSASAGPSASPLFAGSEALPSPTTVPVNSSEFPIPIPTQPQLRNYRSMSFSVGQREIEDHARVRLSPPTLLGKSGLQHRPSRPSLLSEEQFAPGGQPSPLRSVFEAEDDEQNDQLHDTHGSSSSYLQPNRLFNIRFDATSRFRGRSASATTIPTVSLTAASTLGGGFLSGREGERVMPLEEESALIEDEDDFDLQQRSRVNGRSMSMMHSSTDVQRFDVLRRHHWNSASGVFGSLSENAPQSRRHSFAAFAPADGNNDYDLTRGRELPSGLAARMGSPPRTTDNLSNGVGYNDRFYPNEDPRVRSRQGLLGSQAPVVGPSPTTPPNQQLHSMQPYPSPTRQPSPPIAHRGLMGIPPHVGAPQRSNQLLYLVSFKACRADVFYVQEGTGLRVRKGDLVIVEADRGTDLGTVIHENITWQEAKQYKEYYAKEHLTWLMMFATRRVTGAPGASTNSPLPQSQFSLSPGSLPQTQGQLGQDATTSVELKPKMIKRLAQVHEIQTLRDKEANEAKAKRVCQQKVLEHRLPMEILDAEFQMDWKKLTFYYFADSYINFNSLVTDLFKVYKTRIWMSALNPASFAHPTAPHSEPSNEAGHQLVHCQIAGVPNYSQQNQPNPSTSLLRSSPYPPVGPPLPSCPHRALGPHEFGHLAQQQHHNGYAPPFINGLGTSLQNPLVNGGPANVLGTNSVNIGGTGPDWMSLQGLTLHSH